MWTWVPASAGPTSTAASSGKVRATAALWSSTPAHSLSPSTGALAAPTSPTSAAASAVVATVRNSK